MNDTSPKVALMVANRYRAMSPLERMQAASSLHATALRIVEDSLPGGLDAAGLRAAVARRFYAGELPEAAFEACAARVGRLAQE